MSGLFSDLVGDRDSLRETFTAIALGAIGAILLPELSHFTSFIRLHFLHRSKLHKYQHPQSPVGRKATSPSGKSWAFVTGASDGIGYGFVQQLASKGFNVILHGRNKTKIQGIIRGLQEEFPHIEFQSFICDATDRTTWSKAFDELLAIIEDRAVNLTILVNNVGGNPIQAKCFDCLADYEHDHLNALIDMNAVFPAQITRVLLPKLLSNQPSLIINMSSMGGVLPLPYLCGYNAGKSFNRQFSKTLRMELMAEGHSQVEVLSILAASVQSGGMKVDTSLVVPSSKAFAGSVLGLVGCGREEVTGWWSHAVQIWVFGTLMPRWIRERIIVKAMNSTKQELLGSTVKDS